MNGVEMIGFDEVGCSSLVEVWSGVDLEEKCQEPRDYYLTNILVFSSYFLSNPAITALTKTNHALELQSS